MFLSRRQGVVKKTDKPIPQLALLIGIDNRNYLKKTNLPVYCIADFFSLVKISFFSL